MKYFLIILLVCTAGFSLIHNHAYGLWIPQSPDELLKQSQTIFVGNITSIKVLEFAKSSVYHTEENGIERQIIENYTLALDEYTVNVEQFLKNPQNSHTMVVRQPTTSIPGMVVPIGGFEVGDRVLFYVEKIDKENMYSPESFEIPVLCDANSVLSKPRFAFGSDMRMMQNGIQMNDNFTAGIPIQFVYGNDVRTLEGKGYHIDVGINKIIDNKATPIFREKIRADARPCEWIASAEWTITPQTGKYSMAFTMYDDDGDTIGHSGQFFVKDDISPENDSPLKQFKSGIPIAEIQCKEGLELLERTNTKPVCAKQTSIIPMMERDLVQVESFEITSGFFEHTIENGRVVSMAVKPQECGYVQIKLETQNTGKLTISIPKKIFDLKTTDRWDLGLMVLIDGKEREFEELHNENQRTLEITFEEDSETIEIAKICLV